MTAIIISLRVTAPGPADARVSVGRRQFSIGRPVEFDDASPHVAALDTRSAPSAARSLTDCASSRGADASRLTRSRRSSQANCKTGSHTWK